MLGKLVTYEVEGERRRKVEQPKQSVSGTFLRLNILLVLIGIIPWGC
jgi:hypothetical protein